MCNEFTNDLSQNFCGTFNENDFDVALEIYNVLKPCWGILIYEFSVINILYSCPHFGLTLNNNSNTALQWYKCQEHKKIIQFFQLSAYWMGVFSSFNNTREHNISCEFLENLMKKYNKLSFQDLFYYLYNNYFVILEVECLKFYSMRKLNEKETKEKIKEKFIKIYSRLISDGTVPIKWRSEVDMFKLIQSNYSDAIFHYTADWLGLQHLDVYVPSIKTAFEYQGKQHFFAVPFFGGEEKLENRIRLDAEKRVKCHCNDVTLIEWNYDEPITKTELLKKVKAIF